MGKYYIKRKFSDYDSGYVEKYGDNEVSRFEAKEFYSREEASRALQNKMQG